MAKTTARPAAALSLSVKWQWAFIIIMIAGFLGEVASLLDTLNVGTGTRTFEMSLLACPLLSALAGLLFAYSRHKLWLHRIFWAVFLATLSVTVLDLLTLAENRVRSINDWFYAGTSSSYWLAYGWEWTTMILCYAAYCGGLWLLSRKRRA